MTRKQKKRLLRILISVVLLAVLFLLPKVGVEMGHPYDIVCYLALYLFIGYDILRKAARNILHGNVFDENFLMSLASIGAFAIGDFTEAVVVMLFDQIGELFEDYAVGKSRRSIAALMNIRPDTAEVERGGEILTVAPEEVAVGETILVAAGGKIPLDGMVLSGETSVDTAALTGESMPREISPGDEVISGCVNLSGTIRIRVTKPYGESTVAKILNLVENASSKKAPAENFISKFSKYYTPSVVGAALALAVIPSLVTGSWSVWLYRALTFLVISCPCALVISVPLSFFGGIGGASKCGILIKGGNYMAALARCDTVVFDKTGTLTKGRFRVSETHAIDTDEETLLSYAALAECDSPHPIARSIREIYGKAPDRSRLGNVSEKPGEGLIAIIDGHRVAVGNGKLMASEAVTPCACDAVGTVVHVAADGKYLGHLVISDQIKEDAEYAMRALKTCGIRRTVMLTGDSEAVAKDVAKKLAVDEYYAGLLPAGKVERVEALLEQKQGGTLAFVGDGINDAPVLSRADLGISMGAMGSDAAIEASDIVLMDDKLSGIATAITIAKRTTGIVRTNIVFALSVKGIMLLLGALGVSGMWGAVFADVGVSVIAILNAMRALHVKKFKAK